MTLVHEESNKIASNVLAYCLHSEINVVIPKIGNSVDSLLTHVVQPLYDRGYANYLVLIELDRFKTTQRAFYRYQTTKRYVPLAMIFDVFSNEPALSFYRLKEGHANLFSGFCHFSNDVNKGEPPLLVEELNSSDIVNANQGLKKRKQIKTDGKTYDKLGDI